MSLAGITEEALHHLWKTQAFGRLPLRTTTGAEVVVYNQGVYNTDAGPDFSAVRLVIDGVSWAGDVELHLLSSMWRQHGHHTDAAYNKVILHVVWQHDEEALRQDGTTLPTLVLQPYVKDGWLSRYRSLQASLTPVPCAPFYTGIAPLHRLEAFNKALLARLMRKSEAVIADVERLQGDWEQAALRLLFEQFGFKKNNKPLRQLAEKIDFKVLRKLTTLPQLEAYLFGLAGLLPDDPPAGSYAAGLRQEFTYLRKKFRFTASPLSAVWWKFMRLRPANFPAQRLAQLAAFLQHHRSFFHALLEVSPAQAAAFFRVPVSDYWQRHYHFGKPAPTRLQGLGVQGARLLGINVAAVLLVAYGHYLDEQKYIERALTFLENLPPENNRITRLWAELGSELTSAADSQGAIELYNNYCQARRCLDCNIGSRILAL